MALIKCPECGATISDRSEKCVHCGYPLSKSQESKGILEEKKTESSTNVVNEQANAESESESNETAIMSEVAETSVNELAIESVISVPAETEPFSEPLIKKKRKKVWILIVPVVAAIIVAIYTNVIKPEKEFRDCEGLINNGKWEEAIDFIGTVDNEDCAAFLSECYFNLANEKMDAEEWEEAVKNLELSDNSKAKLLIDECNKHIYADYEYQKTFEECIKFRIYSLDESDYTVNDWCKEELDRLQKFDEKVFYTEGLRELADEYNAALQKQYNYLVDESESYDEDDYRDAYMRRLTVIYKFITDYAFFKDDNKLCEQYIEDYSETPLYWEAEDGFQEQWDGEWDDIYTFTEEEEYLTFTNAIDENISVTFYLFYFYGDLEEPEIYDTDFPRVKPGNTCKIVFPEVSSDKGEWSWWLQWSVYDIVD